MTGRGGWPLGPALPLTPALPLPLLTSFGTAERRRLQSPSCERERGKGAELEVKGEQDLTSDWHPGPGAPVGLPGHAQPGPPPCPALGGWRLRAPPTARDPRGGRWTLQRADLPSLCKVSLRPSPASRPSAVPRVRCTRGSRQNPAHPAKPLTAVAPLRGLGLGWGRGSHPSPGAGVPLLGDEDGQHLGMPREARPAG